MAKYFGELVLSIREAKIWLCTEATDMRKSYDGLIGLVRGQLHEEPISGQLFVFVNKRKTMLKTLYFESGGFCIWSKRLEVGQFNFETNTDGKMQLSGTDFSALLEGIKMKKLRQYKRLTPKKE